MAQFICDRISEKWLNIRLSNTYIGWSNHKRIIALCPDGDGDFFETLDEMLDFKIEGKPLKDIWSNIEIISM